MAPLTNRARSAARWRAVVVGTALLVAFLVVVSVTLAPSASTYAASSSAAGALLTRRRGSRVSSGGAQSSDGAGVDGPQTIPVTEEEAAWIGSSSEATVITLSLALGGGPEGGAPAANTGASSSSGATGASAAVHTIELLLFAKAAPKTGANFLRLVRSGFFSDGLAAMYRHEPNFVFQGGGWPRKPSPFPAVPLEYLVPNRKGYVSMARTADPNSATSEFSIMLADNSRWLGPGGGDPHGYAVFAVVVDGLAAVMSKVRLRPSDAQGGLRILKPAIAILNATVRTAPLHVTAEGRPDPLSALAAP